MRWRLTLACGHISGTSADACERGAESRLVTLMTQHQAAANHAIHAGSNHNKKTSGVVDAANWATYRHRESVPRTQAIHHTNAEAHRVRVVLSR
mmetsp:Transcript_24442/g.47870  ORF Transcript_24442/g.47870 Transcript_24442/m.47870 type:complete len:94 (-) Transcript_24442:218-499(-)